MIRQKGEKEKQKIIIKNYKI